MIDNKSFLLSACLRSYGRPKRTRRIIECIAQQNFSGFELLFMGDGCPYFAGITSSDWFKKIVSDLKEKGNRVNCFNAVNKGNDWGAKATNIARKIAIGKYFIVLDNDDKILPEHFYFYYHSIATHPEMDFVYNKTMIFNAGNQWIRTPELKFGSVGHAEIIIRTDFLKTMPLHDGSKYGQDWRLIENMMKTGRSMQGTTLFPTYYVMSLPNQPEPGMEDDI